MTLNDSQKVSSFSPALSVALTSAERRLAEDSASIFSSIWRPVTVECVIYKHFANPERVENPVFIEYVDGEPAGQNNLMGCTLVVNGESFHAVQANDAAILPEYRGPGRLMGLYRNSYRDIKDLDIVFGLPNTQSFPTLKVMRWERLVDFDEFSLPVSAVKILGYKHGFPYPNFLNELSKKVLARKLTNRLDASYVMGQFETCPFSQEDIHEINCTSRIMVRRSVDYFVWKIDDNMAGNFFYLTIRKEEKLLAYLIVRVTPVPYGTAHSIVDWWVSEAQDKDAGLSALRSLLGIVATQSDALQIPYINSASPEVEFFEKLGFNKHPMNSPLMLTRVSACTKCLDLAGSDWVFNLIDTDLILNV